MADLSITRAWNETAEFVKANAGPLFTIAFAMIALPAIILQALVPEQARTGSAGEAGLWLLVMLAVIALSIAGSLAIAALALGRETVVGSAIARGFKRCPAMVGVVLLMAVAAILILIPLMMVMGIEPTETAGGMTEEDLRRFRNLMVLVALIALCFWARLLAMTPVAAAEQGGPIGIIRRSWQLTRGRFWRLLGFLLLFIVAFAVISLAVTILVGLLITLAAGRPEPGNLPALLMLLVRGLLNAAFGVVFTTLVARIYVQLAGDSTIGASTSGS